MEKIIQVKLRESGVIGYYKAFNIEPKSGDYVLVEIDRGIDYGHVVCDDVNVLENKENNKRCEAKCRKEPQEPNVHEEPIRKVVRLAAENDLKQIDDNKVKAKEAFTNCVKKIQGYKLDMKLVDCEYSFDRSKIIFYFTAEGRVDFRELVKDLAKVFKARIELRQIGVRDETKLFGGFGSCGRQLCCATFLKDFEPVMIKMAKEQGLPLNPPKISGLCGRLMCCLSYEYSLYKQLVKELPREGDKVSIPEGKGKVIAINALKGSYCVELEDGRQMTVKAKKKDEKAE